MKNLIISIFKIITQDIILLIFIIVTLFAPYLESDYVDRVIFFDVGQGDSILIISSKGKKILIDTGPGDYVVQKLGKYLKSDDMYLDYVVITHPHSDHTQGMLDIFSRYSVGRVLYYGNCKEYEKADNWSLVKQGDLYWLETLELLIIYPPYNSPLQMCSDPSKYNAMSIVVQVNFQNYTFLLMGDLDSSSEQYLISNLKITKNVVVLKAGHHCSSTSTSKTFLEYIKPSIAICSVGENNKFGHPSPEVLKRFDDLGVKYLLTSIEGDIVIDI